MLAFKYQDEESLTQNYHNTYRKGFQGRLKGRSTYNQVYFNKEQYVQSALKFVVKAGKDYLLNLYDPNEIIDWKDVIHVVYNMINADEV